MIRKCNFLLFILMFSGLTIAECELPPVPSLPNGGTSTLEEMLAGQKAMKAFQAEIVMYRACLVGMEGEVGEDISAGQEAIDAKLDEIVQLAAETDDDQARANFGELLSKYNAAVDSEAAIGGQFNVEIRAYKAANRKKQQ